MRRIKLGFTFGETVVSENRRPRATLDGFEGKRFGGFSRTLFFSIVFFGGFFLLVARSFWLLVVKGEDYRKIADENRIRSEVIRAPRGLILDRNGVNLSVNIPIFRLIERSSEGNEIGYKSITREEALSLESRNQHVLTEPGRSYPMGASAAHVLGYVNEATEEELKKKFLQGCTRQLALGDSVGRGGIEQSYDCQLRGKNGRRILETDTLGQIVRILGEEQPVVGSDVLTTLDARLQEVATSALGGKDGAVVVMEASSGAVLALVSSPGFDPNYFSVSQKNQSQYIQSVVTSPASPLLDRAIGGAYPAGSVFKLAVSSAALSERKISPTFTIDDPGVISAGSLQFSNWYYSEYGRKEGVVDIVRAIARSTDTFFYEIGALTGPDLMAEWAEKFGFGKTTGIDIPGEVGGLIPTPSWKIKEKGEQWYLGNTYNMSIGQGDVLVTPLQVTQMTQVIGNGGRLCRPHVVGVKADCHEIGVSKPVLDLVVRGMIGACSTGGTAFPFFNFKPQVACKTGTAQFGIEGKLTHAWLTVFAPTDKPQVVVTALVEGGGEGSAIAAPVAKAVLEEWFGRL